MYHIVIEGAVYDSNDTIHDHCETKREAVDFIAHETKMTKKFLTKNVVAHDDSEIYLDSKGIRIKVFYSTPQFES